MRYWWRVAIPKTERHMRHISDGKRGEDMSDLIRREDALKELRLDHKDVIYIDKKECARRIKAIPSADRPRGEWIEHKGRQS